MFKNPISNIVLPNDMFKAVQLVNNMTNKIDFKISIKTAPLKKELYIKNECNIPYMSCDDPIHSQK